MNDPDPTSFESQLDSRETVRVAVNALDWQLSVPAGWEQIIESERLESKLFRFRSPLKNGDDTFQEEVAVRIQRYDRFEREASAILDTYTHYRQHSVATKDSFEFTVHSYLSNNVEVDAGKKLVRFHGGAHNADYSISISATGQWREYYAMLWAIESLVSSMQLPNDGDMEIAINSRNSDLTEYLSVTRTQIRAHDITHDMIVQLPVPNGWTSKVASDTTISSFTYERRSKIDNSISASLTLSYAKADTITQLPVYSIFGNPAKRFPEDQRYATRMDDTGESMKLVSVEPIYLTLDSTPPFRISFRVHEYLFAVQVDGPLENNIALKSLMKKVIEQTEVTKPSALALSKSFELNQREAKLFPHPSGESIWTLHETRKALIEIDSESGEYLRSATFDSQPTELVFSANGQYAFLVLKSSNHGELIKIRLSDLHLDSRLLIPLIPEQISMKSGSQVYIFSPPLAFAYSNERDEERQWIAVDLDTMTLLHSVRGIMGYHAMAHPDLPWIVSLNSIDVKSIAEDRATSTAMKMNDFQYNIRVNDRDSNQENNEWMLRRGTGKANNGWWINSEAGIVLSTGHYFQTNAYVLNATEDEAMFTTDFVLSLVEDKDRNAIYTLEADRELIGAFYYDDERPIITVNRYSADDLTRQSSCILKIDSHAMEFTNDSLYDMKFTNDMLYFVHSHYGRTSVGKIEREATCISS